MCFGSREDGAAKKTREIDAQLHKDEKVMQRQVKLLLLGERTLIAWSDRLQYGQLDVF